MWAIFWTFIIIQAGMPRVGVAETNKKFDTEQECKDVIAAEHKRMPDYIRGGMNLDFSDMVSVEGECKLARAEKPKGQGI